MFSLNIGFHVYVYLFDYYVYGVILRSLHHLVKELISDFDIFLEGHGRTTWKQ